MGLRLFDAGFKVSSRAPQALSLMLITFRTLPLALSLTSLSRGIGFCLDERLSSRKRRKRNRRPVVSQRKRSCWACGRRTSRWASTSSEEALLAAGIWAAGWGWSGCRPDKREENIDSYSMLLWLSSLRRTVFPLFSALELSLELRFLPQS